MGLRHIYQMHPDWTVMSTIHTLQRVRVKYFIWQLTQLSIHIALWEGTQHNERWLLFQFALIRGPTLLFQVYIRFLRVIFMEVIPLCISLHKPNLFSPTQLRFILFEFILLPLHARYMFRPVFRPYVQQLWKYFPSAYRQASRLTNTLFALRSLMN